MDAARRLHGEISTLIDGELAMADIELACAMLATPDGQVTWKAYDQIGAALRSQHCGAELSPAFAVKFAARLAAERQSEHVGTGTAQQDGSPRNDMQHNAVRHDGQQLGAQQHCVPQPAMPAS